MTETIQSASHDTLGNLAHFSSEQWNPITAESETFRYIEISNVRLSTGEAQSEETPVAEAPSRARMLVRSGDIIVSTTRPHHGAIAIVSDALNEAVASTGFAVIRSVAEKRIHSTYLWCILRSQICLRQMLQRSSGGNYPAITEAEMRNVLIPLPSLEIQESITEEIERRRDRARDLRETAAREWEAAKAAFEKRLLGNV